MIKNKNCIVCGTKLTGKQRSYCSGKCKDMKRTQYHHVCEYCSKEFVNTEKHSRFCGHSCSAKSSMQFRDMSGSNNPNWKEERNGVYSHEKGYRLLFKPGHPLADKRGMVFEHRYIAYDIITFPKEWVVHHIDGNKINNDPQNLLPMPRDKHTKLHCENKAGTKSCLVTS